MSRSKLAQGWQSRNAPRPGAGAGAGAGAGDADMPDSEAARAAALKNEYQEELNDARETKERCVAAARCALHDLLLLSLHVVARVRCCDDSPVAR